MKIAIISDIHGNIDALNSVLSDIEKENCSKIFCLGDIAMAGPEPSKTISRIHALIQTKDFYIIQGNTDNMLSVFSFDTYNAILNTNTVMGSAYLADSQLLTNEEKEFLKNLPKKMEFELFGIKILLVHGSPRKNNENIYTSANIIFCGHTHMPCGYQTNTEQTVVNVGSVGRPFSDSPDSCYVIMDINESTSNYTIKHKFVKYDVLAASKKIEERGFEGAEKLAKMLIKATSRYPE